MQVKCCECFSEKELTPVRADLRWYFARLLGKKKTERKKTAYRKVKALYSGEALTADDIFEGLRRRKSRSLKRTAEGCKGKGQKRLDGVCQNCILLHHHNANNR